MFVFFAIGDLFLYTNDLLVVFRPIGDLLAVFLPIGDLLTLFFIPNKLAFLLMKFVPILVLLAFVLISFLFFGAALDKSEREFPNLDKDGFFLILLAIDCLSILSRS